MGKALTGRLLKERGYIQTETEKTKSKKGYLEIGNRYDPSTRPLENGLADRKLPHFDLGFLGFRDFRKSLGKQGKRSASSHPAYHVLVQLKELRLQLTEDLFFGGPGLWLEHHDGGITNLIIVPDQFNEKI